MFAILTAIIIFLIRERQEATKLLANYVPPEMAATIVDSTIRMVVQSLASMALRIPGETDDKAVDMLAKEAGLIRVMMPDGSFKWQPIPTDATSAG
jgi:hypothetical protein